MSYCIYCDDPDLCDRFAASLRGSGYTVAVSTEEASTASDAGDESLIITTDAGEGVLAELVRGSNAWFEPA